MRENLALPLHCPEETFHIAEPSSSVLGGHSLKSIIGRNHVLCSYSNADNMFPVLVEFSEPVQDDTRSLQLIVASLQEHGRFAKTLIGIESQLAVVWIATLDVAEYLIFSGPLTLTPSLTCIFKPVASKASNIVEISCSGDHQLDLSQEYHLLKSILRVDHNVSFVNKKLFLRFRSCDIASRCRQQIEDIFAHSNKKWMISVKSVRIDQFQIVSLRLRGPISSLNLSENLRNQGLSFGNLVQLRLRECLLYPPFVVDAKCCVSSDTVYIVCESHADVQKILSCDSIMLTANCCLSQITTSDSLSSKHSQFSLARPKIVSLILWDLMGCPLHNEVDDMFISRNDLTKVASRVDRKVGSILRSKFGDSIEINTSFVLFTSLSQKDQIFASGFKTVSCSTAGDVLRAMQNELLLRHSSDYDRFKQVITICSSFELCRSIIAQLHGTGESCVAVVNKGTETTTLPTLATIDWNELCTTRTTDSLNSWQQFDDLSISRESLQFDDNMSSAWDNVSAITNPSLLSDYPVPSRASVFSASLKPVSLGDETTSDVDSFCRSLSYSHPPPVRCVERTVELGTPSLSAFFQKLLYWNELSDDYDNCKSYADGSGSGSNSRPIDGKSQAYSIEHILNTPMLMIRGTSPAVVELRLAKSKQYLAEAIKNTSVVLLSGWKVQHKIALWGSDILVHHQDSSRATIAFFVTERSVSAEFISLNSFGTKSLSTFIGGLIPIETTWRLPYGSADSLQPAILQMLQQKFATYLDVIMDHPQYVTLQVYGFSEFIDRAQSALQELVVGKAVPYNGTQFTNSSRSEYRRAPVMETIRKVHRGTYSFSDREAGIYFFAYEQFFRDYLEKSCSVLFDDADNADNKNRSGRDIVNAEANLEHMLNKNVVLKVSFYGNSLKNVSAARSYLEQLNTTNLARVQIFFPQVSIRKYKEIYNKRSTQLTMLNNERMTSAAQVSSFEDFSKQVVDPLHSRGFVNIRMKPPMHFHGIRKMQLPADVTVTICGSILAPGNEDLLKEVELIFNSIQSDYLFVSVSIPYTHPLKKQLTIKSMREEIIQRYGLVALKWEEGCRATGSIGTAKIWALHQASLDVLLNEIRSAELELGSSGNTAFGVSYSPQSQFELAFAQSSLSMQSGAESLSSSHGPMQDRATGTDATSVQSQDSRMVIYLPDLTLRYVLLGPPLNTQMTEMLQKFNSQGIRTKYPYRDRSDPHAAALLEGERDIVTAAAGEANSLVLNATKELQSIQIVVSDEQYRIVLANDLACVKFVQGQAGVHMKLDPSASDHDQTISLLDLRFLRPDRMRQSNDRFPGSLVEKALASVSISGWPGSPPTEIYVVNDFTWSSSWQSQIQQFVVYHASSQSASQLLSPKECEELRSGSCAISKFPTNQLECVHWQLDGVQGDFREVVKKSLTYFLQNGVSTVAVLLILDQSLPTDQLRMCKEGLIRAVFNFCNSLQLMGIRIVCANCNSTALVEKPSGIEFVAESLTSKVELTTSPTMASTLIRLVDQTNLSGFDSHAGGGNTFSSSSNDHRVTVTQSNIPLPPIHHRTLNQYGQRGQKVFVMKGLLQGLETGVETLRQVIAKGGVKQ